jgi:hypothetical protein
MPGAGISQSPRISKDASQDYDYVLMVHSWSKHIGRVATRLDDATVDFPSVSECVAVWVVSADGERDRLSDIECSDERRSGPENGSVIGLGRHTLGEEQSVQSECQQGNNVPHKISPRLVRKRWRLTSAKPHFVFPANTGS